MAPMGLLFSLFTFLLRCSNFVSPLLPFYIIFGVMGDVVVISFCFFFLFIVVYSYLIAYVMRACGLESRSDI